MNPLCFVASALVGAIADRWASAALCCYGVSGGRLWVDTFWALRREAEAYVS